jgi:hypothetical protein
MGELGSPTPRTNGFKLCRYRNGVASVVLEHEHVVGFAPMGNRTPEQGSSASNALECLSE